MMVMGMSTAMVTLEASLVIFYKSRHAFTAGSTPHTPMMLKIQAHTGSCVHMFEQLYAKLPKVGNSQDALQKVNE
jgi:hypothetical protein